MKLEKRSFAKAFFSENEAIAFVENILISRRSHKYYESLFSIYQILYH
jgi:hypothetical protein